MGLSHSLDLIRYWIEKIKNGATNQSFKEVNPDFVLPPDYLLYESFRLNYAAYQRTGLEAAHWIHNHFAEHKANLKSLTILDWGCGPGRILRHLPTVFGQDGTYIGVDPNEKSIDWCHHNLAVPSQGNLIVKRSQLRPPLPLEAGSVDLLYGISILPHLSESAHTAWIAELMRVLRPGGMALLTTHGPAYQVKLTESEQHQYKQGKLVIRGQVQEGHRVFTAYHPPKKIRKLLAPVADVLNYVPGEVRDWGIEQDVWIIRKGLTASVQN